jgi:hypothetical protein
MRYGNLWIYLWVTAVTMVTCGVYAQESAPDPDPYLSSIILQTAEYADAVSRISTNEQLKEQHDLLKLEEHLAREAARRGLAETLYVRHQFTTARRRILVDALRRELARAVPAPTEEELRNAYDRQPELWKVPEAYLLDVLEFDAEDRAVAETTARLTAQETVSDEALNALEGRWLSVKAAEDWLTVDRIAPEIWETLADMPDGSARVFEQGDHLLFIRRAARRPASTQAFERVRSTLEEQVNAAREARAWQDYIQQMRQDR